MVIAVGNSENEKMFSLTQSRIKQYGKHVAGARVRLINNDNLFGALIGFASQLVALPKRSLQSKAQRASAAADLFSGRTSSVYFASALFAAGCRLRNRSLIERVGECRQ